MAKTSIALLPILILLLILVGLVVGIILWITGGKGNKKGEMSCGGCGYSVRGLQALNCPECGADLRHIGINRGQNSGSRTLGIVLTMGCGGLLMLGCVSTFFLFAMDSSPQMPPAQIYQSSPSNTATGVQSIMIDPASEDADPTLVPQGDEPTTDQPKTDE